MVHDSEQNSCPNRGGVMSAFLGIGLQLYEWSNCSASELRHYRIAGGTKCLMETDPANDIIKPSFPGQEFDLTYQCKAMFGDHAVVCPRQPRSVSNISSSFSCCNAIVSVLLDIHIISSTTMVDITNANTAQNASLYVHTVSGVRCISVPCMLCRYVLVVVTTEWSSVPATMSPSEGRIIHGSFTIVSARG